MNSSTFIHSDSPGLVVKGGLLLFTAPQLRPLGPYAPLQDPFIGLRGQVPCSCAHLSCSFIGPAACEVPVRHQFLLFLPKGDMGSLEHRGIHCSSGLQGLSSAGSGYWCTSKPAPLNFSRIFTAVSTGCLDTLSSDA